MSPFYKPPAPAVAPAPPAAAAPPGFPGLNPLDPLSQYYAALYSQQLSAYSAAAAAAAMNPYAGLGGGGSLNMGGNTGGGLRASSYHGGGGNSSGGGGSNSMAAAAAAEMQALQAYKDMMTRVAMSGPPVSSASAANPYAALYGLMGYPGMSFPTGRKDP